LIRNYINSLIGEENIQNINPRFVDKFYKKLETTNAVATSYRKPKTEFVAPQTIEKIHKLLACSLRVGEALGLTWDNVHMSDVDIANDDAHVIIDKELARVNRDALQSLEQRNVLQVIPPLIPGGVPQPAPHQHDLQAEAQPGRY